MSVTTALATSSLAYPFQTVLHHALHLPWDVSSVFVEHCRVHWCNEEEEEESAMI